MSDDAPVHDKRFDYIKERISNAFPKLTGPKFEKQINADDIRWVTFETLPFKQFQFQILILFLINHDFHYFHLQRGCFAFL